MDLKRATAFYEAVLGVTTTPEDIGDGQPKSLLSGPDGVVGSIAHGPDWSPSPDGIVIYISGGDDLQVMLDRVVPAGGEIVEPKQPVAATQGYWGRFRDTEGNIIGVLSPH
ncbi:VOC family protein [Demequina sp.]|uniref:VOC family protein n=1 Tax=Demequina sp. TaxID=2050685 RepID=UPI003D14FA59